MDADAVLAANGDALTNMSTFAAKFEVLLSNRVTYGAQGTDGVQTVAVVVVGVAYPQEMIEAMQRTVNVFTETRLTFDLGTTRRFSGSYSVNRAYHDPNMTQTDLYMLRVRQVLVNKLVLEGVLSTAKGKNAWTAQHIARRVYA